jgi:hypothetical protein
VAAGIRSQIAEWQDLLATQDALNREIQINHALYGQADQIQTLNAEISSLGQDNDARQVMLARLQAEQYLRSIGANLTDANSQAYINNAEAIARLNIRLQEQQQYLQFASDGVGQLSSDINSELVDATKNGANAFDTMRNIALKAIEDIENALWQLAVTNPLQNAVTGGNAPTAGGFLSWLTGALGFGSSSVYAPGTVNTITGMLGHAAGGGYIEVGENGPERFYPGVSGTIYPTGKSPANENGVGPIVVNITVNANGGTPTQNADLGSQIGIQVKRAIKQAIDDQTRNNLRKGGMLNPGVSVS